MRDLSSGALAVLDSGRFSLRTLIWVDLASDPVGFWDDVYDATIEGRTYLATGGGFQVQGLASSSDMGVRGVEIVLPPLNPDVVSRLADQPYHQRGVTISLAIIAVDEPHLLNVKVWFVGFIDNMVRNDRIGGQSEVRFKCESISRELSRTLNRSRSDSDQREIVASDGFFKHTGSAPTEPIEWGTRQQPQQGERRRFLGIF